MEEAAAGLIAKLKEYQRDSSNKLIKKAKLFEHTPQQVLSTLKKPNSIQEWNETLRSILAEDPDGALQAEKVRYRRIH